jgi:hypothetical protein
MSKTAAIAPCRELLYDIVKAHGDKPTKSEESAALFIEADDLLNQPRRNVVADETACKAVLRRIWLWNRRAGSPDEPGRGRAHVRPQSGREPADLWLRLCALFDAEYAAEVAQRDSAQELARQPEMF